MGNSIGLKGWSSVINGALILRPLNRVKLHLYLPTPPPPLQVHVLVPFPLEPPFALLARLVFPPPLREPTPIRRRREEAEEGREGQVVVAAEEHVLLPRVTRG